MAIKHKRTSSRSSSTDVGAVQPLDWNDDHAVDGLLGVLLGLATAPGIPYVKADGTGGVTTLSEPARAMIAASTVDLVRAAIGAAAVDSQAFTGAPTVPTAAPGLNTLQIANMAAVKAARDSLLATLNGLVGATVSAGPGIDIGGTVSSGPPVSYNYIPALNYSTLPAAAAVANADLVAVSQGGVHGKQTFTAIKSYILAAFSTATVVSPAGSGISVGGSTSSGPPISNDYVVTLNIPAMTAGAAIADTDTIASDQGVGAKKQTFATIKTWITAWLASAALTWASKTLTAPIINGGTGSGLGKVTSWNSGYLTGSYYPGLQSGGVGTLAVAANMAYFCPFVVGEQHTFDQIVLEVTTGGSASNMRMAVYQAVNGVPTALVVDAGAATIPGTGMKSVAVSAALAPGAYFLGVVFDGACTITALPAALTGLVFITGTRTNPTSPDSQITGTMTYGGPFPATAFTGVMGAKTYANAMTPLLLLRG